MSATLRNLEAEALKLSPRERSELAEFLITSLHGQTEDTPEAVAKAWEEEIARRVADMEAGRTQWIPAEDVFKEVDAIIAEHTR